MATILCVCCKREVRADEPEGRCWECRGEPSGFAYVIRPQGKKDPGCHCPKVEIVGA